MMDCGKVHMGKRVQCNLSMGWDSQTYSIANPNFAVSASFQKKDNSNSELRVQIVKDGSVIKTGSTTAAYGLVLVSSTV